MKRVILLTATMILLVSQVSFSQARIENKMKFYEAEGYILFEEYEEALTLYLQLIKSYPTNSNLKYRIGQCYINTPGEKDKALGFLEEAVRNINPDYREGKFRESGAPYDAYYYLANAYRINNDLDKALETYELFNNNLNTKVYNPDVVKLQIESCLHAREMMKTPMYIRKTNLGEGINDQYPDLNPVVSGDQNSMVYNRLTPFQEALFYVTKVDGKWSNPINIIPDLGLGQESGNYATSLSKDGSELYIYRRGNDYDGNIYVTKKVNNGQWSNIIKLNDNINTRYWESHATVSHDGKKLYFSSNRKGGAGGLDIYVSERDSADAWGPAINLGTNINTEYNEDTPFLSSDDKTIFFSSAGHYNIGGYDIFYSSLLDDGQWSPPLNAGYPLNSTDDDLFFHPVNDGYEGYYSLFDKNGYGQADIFRIDIFSDDHPRKFLVKGTVKVTDLIATAADSIMIRSRNLKTKDNPVVVYSDPVTGEYEFEASHGDYEILYITPDKETVRKELNLSLLSPSDTFLIPGVVLPKNDLTADLKVEAAKAAGDKMVFSLKTEPRSLLTIERWAGDSLISAESFAVSDTIFNYLMARDQDVDKVVFILTDKYGNITGTEVPVEKVQEQKIIRPEYRRIVAGRQASAFTDILKNLSGDDLNRVISNSGVENRQFGTLDDLIAYIREKASGENIKPWELEKTALRAAIKNNILTQAAVDLLEVYADGEMKSILGGIDIYRLNLTTWTDLQDYIISVSGGKLTADDLNKLADKILAEPKPEPVKPEITSLPVEPVEVRKLWYLWIIAGLGLLIILFLLRRRRDKSGRS